jgi:hypothetical protein
MRWRRWTLVWVEEEGEKVLAALGQGWECLRDGLHVLFLRSGVCGADRVVQAGLGQMLWEDREAGAALISWAPYFLTLFFLKFLDGQLWF